MFGGDGGPVNQILKVEGKLARRGKRLFCLVKDSVNITMFIFLVGLFYIV